MGGEERGGEGRAGEEKGGEGGKEREGTRVICRREGKVSDEEKGTEVIQKHKYK